MTRQGGNDKARVTMTNEGTADRQGHGQPETESNGAVIEPGNSSRVLSVSTVCRVGIFACASVNNYGDG